jgi:hypothetical protein
MPIIFSFCLYGDNPKYTRGMIINAGQIKQRFPDAIVQIYIASDVPVVIKDELNTYSNVRLVHTERKAGIGGMFDRFESIDCRDCDIMFVRDADSRIHERDAACIEDFILAKDKHLHIIRDHFYHKDRIMGGAWGIRRGVLPEPISALIGKWRSSHSTEHYIADQEFLRSYIYPFLYKKALIQDRYGYYKHEEELTPFRMPIVNNLFVGQVHLFDMSGNEYTQFEA